MTELSLINITYLCISIAAFLTFIWGLKQWNSYRDVVFLLILAPVCLLWYDSLIIGIGSWIGEGSTLKTLSWPRYITHEILLPFWIIAAGALARRADFNWAKSKVVMALFCLVGTLGFAMGVMELLKIELFPACLKGTVRYVTYVSEAQACSVDMIGAGHAPSGPPIIPILSTVLFLIIGLIMWAKRRWPWLLLGSILMFVMAGMPQSIAGPLLSNIAEPVIAFAALLTARHFILTKDKVRGL